MVRKIGEIRGWPVSVRLALAGAALFATFLFQIPLEREVPGEPFLLFFLIVIGATLAFGRGVGLIAVGLSALLSVFFFEPFGSIAIRHAGDVIKIELYAVLAGGCVIGFASLADALIAANEKTKVLEQSDHNKSILLRELAHGVANNFASIAALISIKSASVSDSNAKSVLDDAIEQVTVMARVHRRLRADGRGVLLDSETFMRELCDDLKASAARGRPLSIECQANSRALSMEQAVLLGLIVNELVTNAIKHAFPDGRLGHIRVGFEAIGNLAHLAVEDDGVGLVGGTQAAPGMGQELVRGLTHQLGGDLKVQSSNTGTSFRLSIPCDAQTPCASAPEPSARLLH
ncbi:MAG TPA: histidine kinase dimerization/phosphoacceptor domain -containing protein [Hyphomicrobiaceae bacterium]|jgi:two-component sensor histidine kinase|nr:histidine kinase dimerization/phosphoacceptor domain -containing protein [Hyphomicrobiaceae bacterium]